MEKRRKGLMAVVAILIVTMILGLLTKAIYSANNNHYVVDVIKDSAVSKDDNLQITEKIVKGANEQYFDSKELNYEVELKNIMQSNTETQVAMVVDSSYSMGINDTENVAKNKAIELANVILSNVKNSRVSLSNNSSIKANMTNTNNSVDSNKKAITDAINGLKNGDGNDSNQGLENAYNTFTTPINAKNSVNKCIIVITDSTDEVSEKMKELTEADSSLKIISILIDRWNSYMWRS